MVQLKIIDFFRAKRNELIALSSQAITGHSTTQGSHRELIIKNYLLDILPKRFSIGSGIISNNIGDSHQTDILIWDEANYPNLKLLGSGVFFLESVKIAIEVKSNWSNEEFLDIRKKNEKLTSISGLRHFNPTIAEEILHLKQSIYELQSGIQQSGILLSIPRPATIAFVINGGNNYSIKNLTQDEIQRIEDEWPDLLFFLAAGKVIYKEIDYDNENIIPKLKQIESMEDSLLFTTNKILNLLKERSVNIENYAYLENYLYGLFEKYTIEEVVYPISRPLAGANFIDADS
jgi:hypothetical protein